MKLEKDGMAHVIYYEDLLNYPLGLTDFIYMNVLITGTHFVCTLN